MIVHADLRNYRIDFNEVLRMCMIGSSLEMGIGGAVRSRADRLPYIRQFFTRGFDLVNLEFVYQFGDA